MTTLSMAGFELAKNMMAVLHEGLAVSVYPSSNVSIASNPTKSMVILVIVIDIVTLSGYRCHSKIVWVSDQFYRCGELILVPSKAADME